jgi:hypothetical protein
LVKPAAHALANEMIPPVHPLRGGLSPMSSKGCHYLSNHTSTTPLVPFETRLVNCS